MIKHSIIYKKLAKLTTGYFEADIELVVSSF